ncbi:MAG: M48 family metallopeptidase [Cellvibrionaceae bacterium]|nr:M48 family metallopeptidase [Cellvibrionaceae bacterium]
MTEALPDIQVRRSKRRSLAINVKAGEVEVRAPLGLARAEIEAFIWQKRNWIVRKVLEQRQVLAEIPQRRYQQGEQLPFLDAHLTLEFIAGRSKARRVGARLLLGADCKDKSAAVQAWYRQAALDYLSAEAQKLAAELGVHYRDIKVRKMKSRWGHCTSMGVLQFNWLIMLAPKAVVNYLLVHELCHLIYFDHGPLFWAKVESICPDYKAQCQWSNQHGHTLVL